MRTLGVPRGRYSGTLNSRRCHASGIVVFIEWIRRTGVLVTGANTPAKITLQNRKRSLMNINQVSELNKETKALVDDLFTHHEWDETKIENGRLVREALANAVKIIVSHVPPSPNRSTAIRKIREAQWIAILL